MRSILSGSQRSITKVPIQSTDRFSGGLLTRKYYLAVETRSVLINYKGWGYVTGYCNALGGSNEFTLRTGNGKSNRIGARITETNNGIIDTEKIIFTAAIFGKFDHTQPSVNVHSSAVIGCFAFNNPMSDSKIYSVEYP